MSFFRCESVLASEASKSPHLLTEQRRGNLEGIIVKQVYDRSACDAAVSALESGRHGLIRTDFPAKFAAFFYGINLNLTHPDLKEYFAEVPRFRDGLANLFPRGLDLQSRLSTTMSALDDGVEYVEPRGLGGERYMFTTIRAHLPGGYIPAHFDDEQAARPSYRYLMPLIRPTLFSFVLAFSQAEQGGALEVFNLQPTQSGERIAAGDRSAAKPDLDNCEKVSIRLDPGDMIIFNSGRYLHRVTPVAGSRTRWTVCSFMAESKSGDRVYCWG